MILLWIFIFVVLCYVVWSRDDRIVFVEPPEFQYTAIDESYFRNMSVVDLRVRNTRSGNEYRMIYRAGLRAWNDRLRMRVTTAVRAARRMARAAGHGDLLRGDLKYALQSDHIENGYPHTMGDTTIFSESTILGSSPAELVWLVIHEAVHVWQRSHPRACDEIYRRWGITRDPAFVNPLGRNNPDTNSPAEFFYIGGVPVGLIYQPDAAHLGDVVHVRADTMQPVTAEQLGLTAGPMQFDHPNEIMAYEFANRITGTAAASPALQN